MYLVIEPPMYAAIPFVKPAFEIKSPLLTEAGFLIFYPLQLLTSIAEVFVELVSCNSDSA